MLQISALIIFLSFPFWVVVITNLVETVYLWQVKEFRFDRVLSHYKYEGSLTLNDEFSLIVRISLIAVMVMYVLSPLSIALGTAAIVALIYYDVKALKDFSRIIHRKIHRPALKSPRNILIVLLMLGVLSLPYIYLWKVLSEIQIIPIFENIIVNNPPLLQGELFFNMPLATQVSGVTIISLPLFITIFTLVTGILLDLLVPCIAPLMALITSPIATIKRNMLISKATSKMKTLNNLKVVAVTGSYGKTTTKEIIEQILKQRFKTIKTEKHNNTEVGISKTILQEAKPSTEIFVAEMGAYKLKETEMCAKIAPPDIAIITGIDEQHMSLYGSFKAILDSTMEIVNELKPNGIVILNGDNEYCVGLASKITFPKHLYYTDKFTDVKMTSKASGAPIDENLYVSDIKELAKGLEFTVAYKSKVEKIKTNITAKHNAGNIACAIITAVELGMTLEDVAKIINSTEFDLPYLVIKDGMNQVKFIDDGYNINPSGYYAGLRFLEKQEVKGKKWVLTQGFIELGDERKSTYQKVAKDTISFADGVITNDLDLCVEITDQKKDYKLAYTESVFDIPRLINREVKEGDVVLIEGPFPKQVLDKIYSSKL